MSYESLVTKIKEAKLSALRVADMVMSGTYKIELDGDTHVLLVDQSNAGRRHRLTFTALAGLRTVKSAALVAAVTTTVEARNHEAILPLQALVLGDSPVAINENTLVTVVKVIHIYDTVHEEFVYREDNYKGYPEYVQESRKAGAMPTDTPDQVRARNLRYLDINVALRQSGVKDKSEAYRRTLPIVTIS